MSASEASPDPPDAPRILDLFPGDSPATVGLVIDETVRGQDLLATLEHLTPSPEEVQDQVDAIIRDQIIPRGLLSGRAIRIDDALVTERVKIERTLQLPAGATIDDVRHAMTFAYGPEEAPPKMARLLEGMVDGGVLRGVTLIARQNELTASSLDEMGEEVTRMAAALRDQQS